MIGVVTEGNMLYSNRGGVNMPLNTLKNVSKLIAIRGQEVVDIIEIDYLDTVTQYMCVAYTKARPPCHFKG